MVLIALSGMRCVHPTPVPATVTGVQFMPVAASDEGLLDSALLVLTGQVGAGSEEPLLARTKGHVRNIFFSSGDYARQGQLLVKLDNHTFVVAPRAGFLGTCDLRIGQYLTLNSIVTTLSKRSYLVVSALLPGDWQSQVHPDDSARVWTKNPGSRVAVGVVGPMGPTSRRDAPVEIELTSRAPFRIGEQVCIRLVAHSPLTQ